jgi:hypothetical protein
MLAAGGMLTVLGESKLMVDMQQGVLEVRLLCRWVDICSTAMQEQQQHCHRRGCMKPNAYIAAETELCSADADHLVHIPAAAAAQSYVSAVAPASQHAFLFADHPNAAVIKVWNPTVVHCSCSNCSYHLQQHMHLQRHGFIPQDGCALHTSLLG